MTKTIRATLAILLLSAASTQAQTTVTLAPPLEQGHSHNDYWRPHPLTDALQLGFKSVEADVFLLDTTLQVGHDRASLRPEKTLQTMYLEPMRQVLRTKKTLYTKPAELWLYVDFKNDGPGTYAQLQRILARYQDVLSTPKQPRQGGVKVILSGGYPRQEVLADAQRLVYLDGSLQDLQAGASSKQFPAVNGDWQQSFKWNGEGPMPATEAARLRQWNDLAMRNGQKIRFWNLPAGNPARLQAMWRELLRYPAVLVGADELAELKQTIDTHAKS